jgi:putative transposase
MIPGDSPLVKLLYDYRLSGQYCVHILISIPPKFAVSQVVGYIKGKSAIHIARNYVGKRRNLTGQHFWARGYYVSTVGIDEDVIRKYIRSQEDEDRRVDQLSLWN